jgi:3-oxoacyl-[acyl-carrier protein] reductase
MLSQQPVTLISGTSKGIGKYLSQSYVAQGHQVIGCSRQPIDWKLEGYQHYLVDITDEKAVREMFINIRKNHKKIDNLICNAGVAGMNHSLLTPVSTARKIIDINLVGTFILCQEAARLMQKYKYGRIVNFTTVAVPLKIEGEAIYAASKAAIITLTEILAKELANWNITVNAIGPTPIETDLIRSVPKEKIDNIIQRQSIQRLGTFEDIINVIDFYIKPESQFVTGQIIYLGGV